MFQKANRKAARQKRHLRIRNKVLGTLERPRLSVYRSLQHIYAQLINDLDGTTLVSASTMDKELAAKVEYGGNSAAAKVIGEAIAQRALAKGIKQVVFDRGGVIYHGRVAALAAAAREAGLEF